MIRTANYSRSVRKALEVIEAAAADLFPVSLKPILMHYKIILVSYDMIVSSESATFQECIESYGEDASAIYKKKQNAYIIAYNNRVRPPCRIRFTIAHEIGHIILGHHKEYGVPILKRQWFDKTLYEVLEDEANCFARNLLCPPTAVMRIFRLHGYMFSEFRKEHKYSRGRNTWVRVPGTALVQDPSPNIPDYFFIQNAFNVTSLAAKTRCHFLSTDLACTPMAEAESLLSHFRFTSRWRCRSCGAPRIDNAAYCYNCGEGGRIGYFSKDPEPERPVFLRYNGGQFASCPFCGNDRIPTGSLFCTVCGQPVSNPCTDGTSDAIASEPDASGMNASPRMLPRQRKTRQGGNPDDTVSRAYRSHGHVFSYLQRLSDDASLRSSTHMNPVGANYCLTCGMPTLYGLMHIGGAGTDRGNHDVTVQADAAPSLDFNPLTDSTDSPPEFFEYRHRLRIESASTATVTDKRTTGDIPTVKYGPNIPYEEQFDERINDRIYKVNACPVCLNEEIEDDAEYCIICGTSLLNLCEGYYEPGISGDPIQHSNPANARFCRICGNPTAYSKLRILPPYRAVLEKMREKKEQEDLLRRELAERDIDPGLFFDDRSDENDHDKKNSEDAGNISE